MPGPRTPTVPALTEDRGTRVHIKLESQDHFRTEPAPFHLLINGVVTWQQGRHCGARAGQVIVRRGVGAGTAELRPS